MQVVDRLEIFNAYEYSTVPLQITSNMSNPITIGHFGTLLLPYSVFC